MPSPLEVTYLVTNVTFFKLSQPWQVDRLFGFVSQIMAKMSSMMILTSYSLVSEV